MCVSFNNNDAPAYLPTFKKSLNVIFDEALPQLLSNNKLTSNEKYTTLRDGTIVHTKGEGESNNEENYSRGMGGNDNQTTKNNTITSSSSSTSPSALTVIDLGSGDGRVVMEARRRGYRAIGYEINPGLVAVSMVWNGLRSLQRVVESSSSGHSSGTGTASFIRQDIWDICPFQIVQADVIFVYGLGPIMHRLAEKLYNEAKDDVIIVSNVFEMRSKHWVRVFHSSDVNVHIYQRRRQQQISILAEVVDEAKTSDKQ
jgi:SAM-dependent methyltransferase